MKLLKDIENCEITSINEKKDFIEIIYKKDEIEKYLTIYKKFQMGSMGQYYGFTIDNKKLENSKKSLFLQDMKKIVKIFHMCIDETEYHNEFIEILFKDNKNTTCSYRINIDIDEDFNSVDFLFTRYENIFCFKSEILEDDRKTQLDYSYYDEYFSPRYFVDEIDENNNIKRKSYGYYDLDYPLFLFGKKLRFEFDEKFGIKAYNLSSFEYHLLPNIEVYNFLSMEEKERLHRFLGIAELYINDLFVNKNFDNEIFDTEKNPELFSKIDKIKEKLEKNLWKKS